MALGMCILVYPVTFGGASHGSLGMMYFPTKSGAQEPQNPRNHRVVVV